MTRLVRHLAHAAFTGILSAAALTLIVDRAAVAHCMAADRDAVEAAYRRGGWG